MPCRGLFSLTLLNTQSSPQISVPDWHGNASNAIAFKNLMTLYIPSCLCRETGMVDPGDDKPTQCRTFQNLVSWTVPHPWQEERSTPPSYHILQGCNWQGVTVESICKQESAAVRRRHPTMYHFFWFIFGSFWRSRRTNDSLSVCLSVYWSLRNGILTYGTGSKCYIV